MSFLAKLKVNKKKSAAPVSKPSASPTPPQDEPVTPSTPKKEEVPPHPPSPTHPVEIDSIFTGLKLSAQVASVEGEGSPYLQRSTLPEDATEEAPSPFSFLKENAPSEDSPEPTGTSSQFGFIEAQDSPQEEKSVFPFVLSGSHDSEQESHDLERKTPPEIVTEPLHDPKSHDKDVKSHDTSRNSPVSKPAPRQLAPNMLKKKKKKRAVRPGHSAKEDGFEIDSVSLSSHTSSLDGSHSGETPLSPVDSTDQSDPSPQKSLDHSVAQLVQLDSQDNAARPPDEELHGDITMATNKPDEVVTTEEVLANDKEPVNTEVPKEDSPPVAPPTEVDAEPRETVDDELVEVFSEPNYSLELSGTDQLTTLLEGFESGVSRIRGSQSLEEVRSTVNEALSNARGQIEKRKLVAVLRSQQAQALTEEDYELAEQINQQLEGTKLTQEHEIAVSALKAVNQWLAQCCETDQNEISFRGEMQSKMAALQDEQSEALVRLEKEHASLVSKDKMKLQGMEDTLEREKGHIALDREHLERREQVLNDEVHRRAADFISEKESLEKELTSVKDEISSLEEKLAALKMQKESIVKHISEQAGKIACVEEELASEKGHLAEEKEAILIKEEKLTEEQEKLAEERKSLESTHKELSSSREGLSQLVARARSVTDEFEKRVEGLKKARLETEGLLKMEEQGRTLLTPSEKLTSLLEKVSSRSSVVDSITSKVLSTQAELSTQRKELSDLQAQVPHLNDAKKVAVAGRQFKEASRIAGEVKAIESKIVEVKGQISTAETRLAELNVELTQHSEELEALKNESDTQEKEEDEAHLTALLASLDELGKVKGRIEASSLSEVVTEWANLYGLLADNLAVKHSWNLDDFKPASSQSSKPVTVEQPSEEACLNKERTPGVGQEEATPTGLSEEIAMLEKQIEEACEAEDYDKAAELEEKLNQLKTQSTS